jgi:restriction system protein
LAASALAAKGSGFRRDGFVRAITGGLRHRIVQGVVVAHSASTMYEGSDMSTWQELLDSIKNAPGNPGTITSEFAFRTDLGILRVANFTTARGGMNFTFDLERDVETPDATAPLSMVVGAVITPQGTTEDGQLVHAAVVVPWKAIADAIERDPMCIKEIESYKWEELIAAAYDEAGFDEVILTPRSGDMGRDVIATMRGAFSVRILGSVKAYKPGHLVKHDDVRALIGIVNSDRAATKGMLVTTSDFVPGVHTDALIKPYLPTRIELMNGSQMLAWFRKLSGKGN